MTLARAKPLSKLIDSMKFVACPSWRTQSLNQILSEVVSWLLGSLELGLAEKKQRFPEWVVPVLALEVK